MAVNAGDVMLGLGLELFMLGVATGVASISPEVGNIMVTFVVGLLIIWLMYHVAFTNSIPNLFAIAQGKKA